MRKADAEARKTGRLCRFSAVGVIFGSTGQTFANGCEVEPRSKEQSRKDDLSKSAKNEG